MRPLAAAGVFLALAVLAATLRFPALAARPMHADEAIHADRMGTLLEGGGYAYDPVDYHGPTLYYLTLVPARLAGIRRYVGLDEAMLRAVPAALGTAFVAAHLAARPFLGLLAAACAGLLAAVSPALAYYSRYYIHEVPLVAFGFGALLAACGWLRRPGSGWALAFGVSAGLMLATKETAILALGALLVALVATAPGRDASVPDVPPAWRLHALVAVLAAAGVAALMLSSLLQRPVGVVDAVRSYGMYLERATGDSLHVHAWHYYLGLLFHFPADGTPIWSEGLILLLAVVGAVSGWTRAVAAPGADPRLVRFLAWYTLSLLLVYSAIPYKTPWCLLGFLHGMILLAGVGAAGLVSAARGAARVVAVAALVAGAAHLGWQAYAASFRFAADPRNPYVYAHTGTDVFEIVRRIEALSASHPAGRAMPVQVVSRENVWPLPFYLRGRQGVEWWTGVSDAAAVAPAVVATPDMEEALVRRLYDVPPPGERELFVPIFERPLELRPGLELRGYAAASLWDAFRRREAEAGAGAP